MKREGDEKGTAEQSEGKNHPVNGFLVPRAGGGTAPVPPDESPYLHTGFHFEFHSLKEETLFIATPQSHFVRQATGKGRILAQCKCGVQCRTPRGAIVSMGLRGRQGA